MSLESSGSEIKIIKKAPQTNGLPDDKPSLGAHTDFGSLSFLRGRHGGLQVLVQGNDVWQYVKPVPGLAVCNIGDALKMISGGILRSNIHRVVAPPGEQRKYSTTCERVFNATSTSGPQGMRSREGVIKAFAVTEMDIDVKRTHTDDPSTLRSLWPIVESYEKDFLSLEICAQTMPHRCFALPTVFPTHHVHRIWAPHNHLDSRALLASALTNGECGPSLRQNP
ncbi:Clavaminate synthase-like protein [Sistotremastrum suecicum HHB10207 ss-3]|uniref:Clavaminate synthase-like protein n=1 Tax=Sistotremastrum suecicum HHB10207 ss-3 TaxID=1314776 RepID=A0A165WXQ5_9AGAM|nr:Clavaminate synthase-like protein [Sistotremastrum suecicum HHB10207 ss-3]